MKKTSWRGPPINRERAVPRAGARLWALVTVIVLVSGGCIGIIEAPAPPTTSTSLDETVHLRADEPVAVRHLAFEVTSPSRGIDVKLVINANRFITETTGEFAEDVTLSIRSDDPETTAFVGSPGDARPGAIFSLTDLCARGCQSGVTVVVRGTSDARPIDDIAISAVLSATAATNEQSAMGTTLSLRDDGATTFDGDPATVRASAAPAIAVSPAAPKAHVDLHLHVDPMLLYDPLAFPLVGSLALRANGDPTTHEQLWNPLGMPAGRVTVDGQPMGMAPESGAYEIDWLRLCTPRKACDVEIGIDVDYDQLAMQAQVTAAVSNRTASPPPPSFQLTVEALARLETFDGSPLPSEGLTLTATP